MNMNDEAGSRVDVTWRWLLRTNGWVVVFQYGNCSYCDFCLHWQKSSGTFRLSKIHPDVSKHHELLSCLSCSGS